MRALLQKVAHGYRGLRARVVLAVAIFAASGATILLFGSAATPVTHIEPEDGSLSGAAVVADGSASGGSAVQFSSGGGGGNPGVGYSQYLAYDLPSNGVLKATEKKVFAHYFTPYPISIDNQDPSTDYYARNYLTIDGEKGIHANYGGFLRSRPLGRPISSDPNWKVEDMKTEVRRATEAGIDGFTVDMLGVGSGNTHWERLLDLLEAAPQVDPDFKIVLMPDGGSSDKTKTSSVHYSPSNLASYIAQLESTHGSALYHLDDGRLVVSPYRPEASGVGASFYSEFISIMQNTYGITVALVPCFLNYEANVDAFEPFSYGFSNWGNRSPAQNGNIEWRAADAHSRGKIWMMPVSLQDERPRSGLYDEANNTENLRVTWQAAINSNSDWVQIPTWNDYSEGTEISPSSQIGWSPLDINAYYLTRYKTGTYPSLQRDVLYVSHREHFAATMPIPLYSKVMVPVFNTATPRDTVEVLTFFTSPRTVTVNIGSDVYTYTAPAGLNTQLYPLQLGSVSASFSSGGSIITTTSGATVLGSFDQQDLQYHFVSSARDGATAP